MTSCLVMIPIRPGLAPALIEKCYANLCNLTRGNPDLDLSILVDRRYESQEPGDATPWSKVARVRNRMIEDAGLFDYFLWIDADIVEYDFDLPTRMIQRYWNTISAPMVLVEGTKRFYDTCAFIIDGQSGVQPDNLREIQGRNLNHHGPPYWGVEDPPKGVVTMDMDCVGSFVMVPAAAYDIALRQTGTCYTDHPAFTDHFNMCQVWRRTGGRVIVCRDWTVYHADLPKYGEPWH